MQHRGMRMTVMLFCCNAVMLSAHDCDLSTHLLCALLLLLHLFANCTTLLLEAVNDACSQWHNPAETPISA